MRIMLASSPGALQLAMGNRRSVTVEAEYGDECVYGTMLTLAHHGPRKGNICPCLASNLALDCEVIGISHFDLDTLGGILAVQGRKPYAELFWSAAAFVDVNGPHKLVAFPECTPAIVDQLNAWWAWSESHRIMAPRDVTTAIDVQDKVEEAYEILKKILADDTALLDAGRAWALGKYQLARESLIQRSGPVILRASDQFVNHLYDDALAVVAFNTKLNSVTVSLSEPIVGVSARAIVQQVWGDGAGGHDGIAGSPRGQTMTLEDAERAFHVTRAVLAQQLDGGC